jgi:hypothetical protein
MHTPIGRLLYRTYQAKREGLMQDACHQHRTSGQTGNANK